MGFVGVNMKDDPASLAAGLASYACNKRFNRRVGGTRPGILTPVFANLIPYGTIYGEGLFSDPDGNEWGMFAVSDGVWFCREGRYPRKIDLGAGLSVTGTVRLEQTFDGVVMFRGVDLDELAWDGDWTNAFELVEPSDDGTGTESIPPAEWGIVFKNRMLVPADRDSMIVSDVLNYTRYLPVVNEFRFNQGSDDSLVFAFPHTETSLLVFKDQSIFLSQNIYGDLSELVTTEITRELGLSARDSVVRFGADVLFLAATGIYALSETQNLKLHAGATALSAPVQPLFDRINWDAVCSSQAVGYGDCYLLAVPIDGATAPNAVFVFNTRTQLWEGFDTWADPTMRIHRWFRTEWGGQKRLYAVDRANARVYLMYEGTTDIIGATEYQICDEMWTRGYRVGSASVKKFARGTVGLSTLNPRFSITSATDGVNETKAILTNRTKSRVRYYTHGRPNYDPSNVNDDHATPMREDYSVTTATPFNPGSGMALNLKQQVEERFPIGMMGGYVVLRISSNQGGCDVISTSVQAVEAERDTKEKA